MLDINKFTDNYVPDNHWLSKSMELMKLQYGTYWYIKKMLVYYYYIFILKKMDKKELYEIVKIFDSYIKSLDKEVRDKAAEFFYRVDIRNTDSIITLNEFSATNKLLDNPDSQMLKVRKYYYSYLMDLEGQNPEKALILEYVICERNYFKGINKARVKLGERGFSGKQNDVHGFLRNERQILFLMGLLNYTDSYNIEKYSPTGVGTYAIYANNNELVLLLEMQKIRQVSRNPLVYYGLAKRARNRQIKKGLDTKISEKASLRIHPYMLFLKYLSRRNKINTNEFRFLISRTTDNHNQEDIIEFDHTQLDELRKAVNRKDAQYITPGSNSSGEDIIRAEDFSKEFKKYMSGIFKLPKDCEDNLFTVGVFNSKNNSIVTNVDRLDKLIIGYEKVLEYIENEQQNADLYKCLNKMHKYKYRCHITKKRFDEANPQHIDLIFNWLSYFISVDTNIIRLMLKAVSEANSLDEKTTIRLFPNLCRKVLGVTKVSGGISVFEVSKDYLDEKYDVEVHIPKIVTLKHLQIESDKYLMIKDDFREERKRNIALVKKYIVWKKQQGSTVCEACGEELSKKIDGQLICHVHHIIPFFEDEAYGPDHYMNLIAICPNCHEKFHAKVSKNEMVKIYNRIKVYSVLKMSLIERIYELYKNDFLLGSSLEYARVKGMITAEQGRQLVRGGNLGFER